MTQNSCHKGFCGIGKWQGCAEVYNGSGQFLGNAMDQRHVRSESEGRIKIDLSFVGPLKFAGHYFIEDHGDQRYYQGPANFGHGQSLCEQTVVANAYWPSTGLNQEFFLMVTPDQSEQFSLALMSRGSQLIYAIVGENRKILSDEPSAIPMQTGTSYDLNNDPRAGRKDHLLLRPGRWVGELATNLDSDSSKTTHIEEKLRLGHDKDSFQLHWSKGSFQDQDLSTQIHSNELQSWTTEGSFVGSSSYYGGKACVGTYHLPKQNRRLWRREVTNQDGSIKAVVNTWYEGQKYIGHEWGFLKYHKGA